ncbi:hypothetical protein HRG_002302 [Hirsutella rhossiliensis]|uniref:Uncharacterized protein n=1 Tax=Hirsutella rhossiliensis TaxID=111463 RepID=A0A9P8N272_9HYPO|nr:uncharacterized protein HRG_02302 [Hirsutella rhossiliensis]KAH0966893.1 hypothetical protein HRG_02302 [Hirsutella rhossiliensis]
MSRRWYFETAPSGKEQVISVKRTRSHRHHHRHHRHHDPDVYRVSRDEWDGLVERERCLAETNRSLADEANGLRASLAAAQAEAHNLSNVVVPQLQGQINALSADNEALRLSVDNVARQSCEEERLRQIIDRLENDKCCLEKARCSLERENADLKTENASLRGRIRCPSRPMEPGCGRRLPDLSRDAEYWKDQCRQWRSKFEDTRRRHDDTCGILEIRTQKMRAYEEILKRRRII